MGWLMGSIGARFLAHIKVTFFVLLIGAPVRAAMTAQDFNKQVARVATDVQALESAKEIDLAKVTALQNAIKKELDPSFKSVLKGFLGNAQTPSLEYLGKQKAEMESDLAELFGTADKSLSRLDGSDAQLLSSSYAARVRAYLVQEALLGRPQKSLQLMELFGHYVQLPVLYLKLSQMEVAAQQVPSMSWASYFVLYQTLQAALAVAKSYYPTLPDYSLGQASGQRGLQESLNLFAQSFLNGSGQLAESHQKWLKGSLDLIQSAQLNFDLYRHHFFPKMAADEQLKQLMAGIIEMPGADQCFEISRGVSSPRYNGFICRPAQFYSKLNRFLGYHQRVAEPVIVLQLMDIVTEYRDGAYGEQDEAWKQLRTRISSIGNLAPHLETGWKNARAQLLDGEGERKFRELVDSEASGTEIWKHIMRILLGNGISLRPGLNEMVVAGTVSDFTPDYLAISALKTQFTTNVIDQLKKYRLNKSEEVEKLYQSKVAALQKQVKDPGKELLGQVRDEALLETLEDRLITLNADAGVCPLLTDTKLTEEQKEDRSPWVMNIARNREITPSESASSNATTRLSYYGESQISNLVTIQNSDRPEKMFAGIAVRTAVSTILPNAVQARMLLQDVMGEYAGDDLKSLGINQDDNGVVMVANQKYRFLPYEVILRDAKNSWKSMLARYANRHKIGDRSQMEVAAHFGKQYRKELAAAAKLARKWDKIIEELRYDPPKDSPTFVDELHGKGTSEMLRAYGAPEGQDPAKLLEGKIHEWITMYKRTYALSQHATFKGKDDHEIYKAALGYHGPTSELTVEQFREEFRKYGKRDVGAEFHNLFMGYRLDGFPQGYFPRMLDSMYLTVLNAWEKRVEHLTYSRNVVLFRFPALRLNDAWKTYQGTESEYRKVMAAYFDNAVKEANRFQALGAGGPWDQTKGAITDFYGGNADANFQVTQARRIIDDVITNLPLLDVILKNFPDQALFVCNEQAKRQLSEERMNKILAGVSATGAAVSMIGLIPGAQVVGLVGLGISGVAALAQTMRARAMAQQLDSARNFAVASAGQVGLEADVRNWDYLRQEQARVDEASFYANVDLALTAVSFIGAGVGYLKASKALSLAEGRRVTMLEVLKRDFVLFGQNTKALVGGAANKLGDTLTKWKFVTNELQPIRLRYYKAFLPSGATGELAMMEKGLQTALFSFDELDNAFWHLLGKRWDTGRAAFGLRLAGVTATASIPFWYLSGQIAENEAATMMGMVYDHPAEYKDLIDANAGGWMSHAQVQAAVEATPKLKAKYLDAGSEKYDAMLTSLSQQGVEDGPTVDEARKNIKVIYGELSGRLKELSPSEGEYYAVKKNLRAVSLTMRRWNIQ